MRARIHRGTEEIGSCVELEHDGYRLVLDVGRSLTAGRDDEVALPGVPGLATGDDPHLLGVILSHGHPDHWGLMAQVHPDVPRYLGKAAADILRAAKFWGTGIDLAETGHLEHRKPFVLGPFTITPYLNDHCAFDAYSLLVEAGESRLFYTGEFRGLGRKGKLFDELLLDPPTDVDALVCEGMHAHREELGDAAEPATTESQVEKDLAATMKGTDGLVVVLSSPQNIDRLVTTYRAALRAKRDLVLDLYGADVAAATGHAAVPQLGEDWPRVRVYLPHSQRVRVLKSKEFHRVAAVLTKRSFAEHLAAEPSKYVLFGSFQSELERLRAAGPRIGAVVWSMWDGYLTEPSGVTLRRDLAEAGIPLIHHHTAGPAQREQLQELVAAMRPGRVVPIHTDLPEGSAARVGQPGAEPGDQGWWTVGEGADDRNAVDEGSVLGDDEE
jgi:ribonuclease J